MPPVSAKRVMPPPAKRESQSTSVKKMCTGWVEYATKKGKRWFC